MIVIGLDPGLAQLALAAIDLRDRLAESYVLAAESIETSADDPPMARRRLIWSRLDALCAAYPPELVAFEVQTFAALGAAKRGLGGLLAQWKTSAAVEQIVGIALAIAFARQALPVEVTPKQAKIALLGKGAGNADKARVKKAVLEIMRWPGGAPKPHRIRQHATDAVAIAVAGGRLHFAETWKRLATEAPPEAPVAESEGR